MANYTTVNWLNNSSKVTTWVNTSGKTVDWISNYQSISTTFDWTQTLLSQYSASPTIKALLQSFNDAIDPTVDIANFYNNIWNVNTAVGNGLDIWGQIVGVSRYLTSSATQYLGYAEANSIGTEAQPFNQAPFYTGTLSSNTFALTDEQYRRLILVKAAANISSLTIPSINALLRAEFGTSDGVNPYGDAYVIDNINMTFTYYLKFAPSALQLAIINNSGVFPRPAGVQMLVNHL
jgi:Protein of unknown function (DUF2612)